MVELDLVLSKMRRVPKFSGDLMLLIRRCLRHTKAMRWSQRGGWRRPGPCQERKTTTLDLLWTLSHFPSLSRWPCHLSMNACSPTRPDIFRFREVTAWLTSTHIEHRIIEKTAKRYPTWTFGTIAVFLSTITLWLLTPCVAQPYVYPTAKRKMSSSIPPIVGWVLPYAGVII